MNVLVAGGAGYIGSHTTKRLKDSGHNPVIFDNGSRGHAVVADILKVPAIFSDLNDRAAVANALREHKIDCVMHFAAYAYVGESVEKPLMYYWNNVATTISVLECMRDAGVNRFVFSSTCATYGDPPSVPITEDMPKNPVSPYGRSKLMVEGSPHWVPSISTLNGTRRWKSYRSVTVTAHGVSRAGSSQTSAGSSASQGSPTSGVTQ